MIHFSILIPTYNRKEKLQKVLECVFEQEGISEGELIVGIDGSSDGTKEFLETFSKSVPNLSFFWIPNSGRSVIRNRLLERAKGDLIIFIQDDIVVTKGWLQAHLEAHQSHEGAVVGHMTWYPEMTITPYMRWLENGGPLLSFKGLSDGNETNFWHFYMGNISIPRYLIKGIRFDEDLKRYGWEDIVFGYQFVKNGGKIFYSKKSLAYHWDEYLEEGLPSYARKLAVSRSIVDAKYPEMGLRYPWWKKMLLKIFILASRLFWPFLSRERKWYCLIKNYNEKLYSVKVVIK